MQSPVCYLHPCFAGFLSLTSNHSPDRTIHNVSFRIGGGSFLEFPRRDLERLKDERAWLSDTHIDFALQCVSFLHVVDGLSESNRDFFLQCLARKPSPNQNMLVLPCIFWTQLSQDPEKFTDKYRSRTKLLEHDFIVMPMYEK
jgi:hypothetical protein